LLAAPTLHGTRTTLRPWRRCDAPALEPACGDPDICRYTTVPRTYSLAEAEAWIGRQHDHLRAGDAIVLAIEAVGVPAPVGMVGLFGLDRGEPRARFGYWVVRGFRGRGLVTDAVRTLAEWAFANLPVNELVIDVERENTESGRVADAVGARTAGEVRREVAGRDLVLERYVLPPPR
jgi:RimJ/RimL family protein N-acetyltransferase